MSITKKQAKQMKVTAQQMGTGPQETDMQKAQGNIQDLVQDFLECFKMSYVLANAQEAMLYAYQSTAWHVEHASAALKILKQTPDVKKLVNTYKDMRTIIKTDYPQFYANDKQNGRQPN